jgi:hypothetical protein
MEKENKYNEEKTNEQQQKHYSKILSFEEKKDLISQNILKLPPKIQKAVNKLVDFFDEASEKGFEFVTKLQLEDVFPDKYEKLFNTALEELMNMHVLSTKDFKDITIAEDGNCIIVDDTAYSLIYTQQKMETVPQLALRNSLTKIVSTKSRLFFDPKESLFSFEEVSNIQDIDRALLNSAFQYIVSKEQIAEFTYYSYKGGTIAREKGYFVKRYAFDVLQKIGEKFNEIYNSREEKINESIQKRYSYIMTPNMGFKDQYIFSPTETLHLAKHITDNSDTYGKLFYIMAERSLQLYEQIPPMTIDKIENERKTKKESVIIEDIVTAASKFFENYQDIISETSLIDTLAQMTSHKRDMIPKAFPKLPSKIRKAPFIDKERIVTYYASISALIPILRSIRDINIRMEYIRLEVVISMFEELFERVKLGKMDKNNLCGYLQINPASYDDLKKEVEQSRKRLSENRQRSKGEKKKGFFERLFSLLFGKGNRKKDDEDDIPYTKKTPEMLEREFYNKCVREIINYFNRYKRPVEIKKMPANIKGLFNNDDDELRSFINHLTSDQILKKIKVSNKKIGQLEYYVPFSFFTNPQKYESMVEQIKAKEKFIDVKQELLNTLMKEYSTIQGKIKK